MLRVFNLRWPIQSFRILSRHLISTPLSVLAAKNLPDFSRQFSSIQSINRLRNTNENDENHFDRKQAIDDHLDRILMNAKEIVREPSSNQASIKYDLKEMIDNEILMIDQILRQLFNTSQSINEMERIKNQSFDRHFLRGLVVLLVAKASNPKKSKHLTRFQSKEIEENQWEFAKIVEMIYMATITHKNMRKNTLVNEIVDGESINLINNKISVLYGDFLWAQAWKQLVSLGDVEVINLMSTVLVNISKGQFTSEVEAIDCTEKLSIDHWMDKNYLLNSCLIAKACQSVLKLSKIDQILLQRDAFEFGKNFGFFHLAYQEYQWIFKHSQSRKSIGLIDSIDLLSLPIIIYSIEKNKSLEKMIEECQNENDRGVDYSTLFARLDRKRLYGMVCDDNVTVQRTKEVIENFRQNSLRYLKEFPSSNAKNSIQSILNVMSNVD
ncbi:pyrroline-5-carboxylate reductase [Sarcoptes scabiei]|nr:pyrroline-5-carboxylate reductase [Sarcoptes scabiei]